MASEVLLEINGHKYIASGFSYSFNQGTDFNGESVSDMTLPLVGRYYHIAVVAKLDIDDRAKEMEDFSKEVDLEILNSNIEQGFCGANKYIDERNSVGVTYRLINISIDTFVDILNNRFYTLYNVISFANNTPIVIHKDIVMLYKQL